MDINQIEDVIYNINEQIIKQEELFSLPPSFKRHTPPYGMFFGLELKGYGYNLLISYLGVPVWSNINDVRLWIEETNNYEPLDLFLKREINNINKFLANIKL